MNDAIIQVASAIASELGVSACDSLRVSGWSTSHRIPDESSILTYVTMGPLQGYRRRRHGQEPRLCDHLTVASRPLMPLCGCGQHSQAA